MSPGVRRARWMDVASVVEELIVTIAISDAIHISEVISIRPTVIRARLAAVTDGVVSSEPSRNNRERSSLLQIHQNRRQNVHDEFSRRGILR